MGSTAGRLDFTDLHGPQRHLGQALPLAMPRRTQRQGTLRSASVAARPGCGPRRGTCKRTFDHRLSRHSGPHIALGGGDTPVPRGPNQQLDALRPRSHQQVKDIGLPIAHTDKTALRTLRPRPEDGVKAGQPFWLSFCPMGRGLRRARLPLSAGSRAHTCWANSPKGTRSGVTARVLWTCKP